MLKGLNINLALVNLFLGFLGYPLIVLIGTGFGIEESQIVTIPFRYAYLLFSLLYLAFNVFYFLNKKFNINFFLFNLFWALYILRLVYDVYFRDIEANQFSNNNVILGFALGVSFLPALNMQYITKNSIERFYKVLFPTLLIICILSIPFAFKSLEESFRAIGGVGLSTISYGHYGASLVIISLFRIVKHKFLGKVLSIAGVIVGLVIMGLSASKSPFASLAVVLVFYLLSRLSIKRFITIGILLSALLFSFQVYLSFLVEKGSGFVLRFERFIESGDALRFQLYNEAVNEFIEHPFLGNQFVLENGIGAGIYPHNLVLESFLALGIIGGTLFLFLVGKSILISYDSIKRLNSLSWISFLFIQYLVFGMMSGGIYNSNLFWIFLILTLSLANLKNDNDTTPEVQLIVIENNISTKSMSKQKALN